MVVTENQRKSWCCSAAKEVFFRGADANCVREDAIRDAKRVSELRDNPFTDNGYLAAMQSIGELKMRMEDRGSRSSILDCQFSILYLLSSILA